MPQAATKTIPTRDREEPDPSSLPQWLSIDRVHAVTGIPLRTLQRSAKSVWQKRGLAELRTPPGGGKPAWCIHHSVDRRLDPNPARGVRDEQLRESLLERHAARHVERAYTKMAWLARWERALREPRSRGETADTIAQRIVAEAKRAEASTFRISVRSLHLWRAQCNAIGDNGRVAGVSALVDVYNGPMAAGGTTESSPSTSSRSAEAIEYFYELYHTQSRLSIAACHACTLRAAKSEGWCWPSSCDATRKWLSVDDDLSLSCLLRDGQNLWARRYMPHLEIDYSALQPGEAYVCDHAQCDFWVTDDRDRQIRPWLTAIMDCRSRSIVGWHLGPSPHQDSIIAAMRMAFRDRAIPRVLRIDNGKDFTSKRLTGLTKTERRALRALNGKNTGRVEGRNASLVTCDDVRWRGVVPELSIEISYATPYAPWVKGQIERFFGTLHGRFDKTFATYCGDTALRRPECLEDIRNGYSRDQRRRMKKKHGSEWARHVVLKFVDQADVPTMVDARSRLADWLLIYHATAHRGQAMNGCAPQAVWATATTIRKAEGDALLFLMTIVGDFMVGPNGVRVTVGAAPIGYGAHSAALRRHVGRRVLIAVDPDDIGVAWALTMGDRKLIARLEANKVLPAFTKDAHAREAIGEMNRDRRVMRSAARTAASRTRTASQRIARVQREQAAALRATGTDDVQANIIPVPTGFESVSMPGRTRFEPPAASEFDGVSFDDLDLSTETETEAESPADDPYGGIDMDDVDLSLAHDDAGDDDE